jgi:hypothetical protein
LDEQCRIQAKRGSRLRGTGFLGTLFPVKKSPARRGERHSGENEKLKLYDGGKNKVEI